jgi:hypothetical protein
MATATKKEEAYPWKASTSSMHTTNLKQSILETFNIYGRMPHSKRETNKQLFLGTAKICQLFYSATKKKMSQ